MVWPDFQVAKIPKQGLTNVYWYIQFGIYSLVYTVWYIQFGIQFDIYSLVYTIEFSNDFLHIKAIMLKCGQTEGQTD